MAARKTPDGSEQWGYVQVRPSKKCAHTHTHTHVLIYHISLMWCLEFCYRIIMYWYCSDLGLLCLKMFEKQKLTCSGGTTEVHRGLMIQTSHGQ